MARISVSELAQRVSATGSVFFTRDSMRFFGDTMRNYRVVGPVTINTPTEHGVTVWELARKKPVKHKLQSSAYFDVSTFERRHATIEVPCE